MKYIIRRTSGMYGNKEKPVDENNVEEIETTEFRDIRSFKDKEEWLSKFPEDDNPEVIKWGTYKGEPYRLLRRKDKHWIININTLEELNKLVEKYGEIIICPDKGDYPELDGLSTIEIYDDYRE